MKIIKINFIFLNFVFCLSMSAVAQNNLELGPLEYANVGARARVESPTGPLAGTNIWGQLFGGPSSDSMVALGVSVPHFNGSLYPSLPVIEGWSVPYQPRTVLVPGVPLGGTAYLQLFAWDGAWGIRLEDVPPDFVASTEIASQRLVNYPFPLSAHFEQAAVVQLIPEPGTYALFALGGMLLIALGWVHRLPRK